MTPQSRFDPGNNMVRLAIEPYDKWLKLTEGAASRLTQQDRAVREALRAFHQPPHTSSFDTYNRLRTLYRAVDSWFRDTPVKWPIEKPMSDLHQAVVYRLCDFFQVTVNVLPGKLEELEQKMVYWHAGEHHMATNEMMESQLVIEGGKVTQWNDALKNFEAVSTNSNRLAAMSGEDVPADCVCDAGFVFSLWDEFYVAKHDMDKHRFHSQYMGGNVVRCAGEIVIRKGIISKVSNVSGHYRPPATQLLPALWAMQKRGVKLADVTACVRQGEDMFVCNAAKFLAYPNVCLSTANPRPNLIKARYHDDGMRWAPF